MLNRIFRDRLWKFLLLLTALGLAAPLVAQQSPVPERRMAISPNTDFPGNDLEPVFDTSFDSCRQTCAGDDQCKAFTFNEKSNACFPKTGVGERLPFQGAVSAQLFDTDPLVRAMASARAARLAFLPEAEIKAARAQAEGLAERYLTHGWNAGQLNEAALEASARGDLETALRFTGAGLNLTDSAYGWAELARLALAIKPENGNQRRDLQRRASAAAINAFLRAPETPNGAAIQVNALNLLATSLERRGQGRQAISALRLAQDILPRLGTEEALDRLVGLYGFRITEHRVDNNSARPRICAQFSEPLVPAGVDYADYLRLPEPGLAVEASGSRLCIDGVRHGERYRITFREGLPAESGEKLVKSVDLNVYVRDRDPSARFVGRAYVLPRGRAATIPIVTVNLSEVDLNIYRVGERNLLRAVQAGYFGNPLAVWEENEIGGTIGRKVWSGTGEVVMEVNRDVTTALPVGEAIAGFEPGVYVMRARVPGADPYDASAASQWFVVTDLGLSTLRGSDGLHVFVRSLNSAEARAGVRLQLIARNNEVLGEAMTDASGYARFAPGLTRGQGGAAPALLTAETEPADFAFLNLREAGFDLSDRGVAGRPAPPPVDVFLTTDRGAYRPGETVNVTALARNGRTEAIEGLPLTAIVTRPDGVEFTRSLLADAGAGGRVLALPLPQSAQRGTWAIRLHSDIDDPALVSGKFLVEDLVPERIDFDLALENAPVGLGDVPVVGVTARYLFGAPGAGLRAEAETRLSLAEGLKGWPGFRFGRQDESFRTRLEFTKGDFETDAEGRLSLPLALPDPGEVTRPLEMTALVRLREGSGRPVERVLTTPLAPRGTLLGIRPQFKDVVPEGANAGFDVIAVGPDLAARDAGRVGWVLNRVRTRYQWYESYGNWNYEPITTRTRVASGELDLTGTRPEQIEAAVDWGRYELVVETLEGAYASASFTFYAGWYAPADTATTPDTLELGLDKEVYRIGDTARLRLVPRYPGTALVTVMSNRLIAMKTVTVTEGENLIDLDVTEDWGAGAYVSASVIRPMDVAAGRNPARALGLGWASVDPGPHRLAAEFTSPDEAAPRATMTARLRVAGVSPGETAYATIAAVDLGILNITGFQSPDPEGHYFGQRRLGMEIRDLYGRLIDGLQGAPGRLRSGGDAALAERLNSPPPTEDLVSYFSGPLVVGEDGMVTAEFDIPEFNGTLRLMAVVWSKTGVGQAEKDVLIRDPVVLSASLPRFLAPGDSSRMRLEIAHAKGPAGAVGIEVSSSGGLDLDQSALPASIVLGKGERVALELPLTASTDASRAAETPEITVVLTAPGGAQLSKTLRLPVRANDPEIARTSRVALAAGDTFTLDADVFTDFLPGSGRAVLSVGPIARFNTPGLLSALDRYPYGCTEQLTSRAMPLLYFQPLATSLGLDARRNVATRIEQAIAEILSNQSSSGSFGLWAPGSGDLWLDSYVSDFLSRARARGFDVPRQAFRLAIDNLRNRVNYAADFEKGGEGIAYALMVLAREGAANIGDLRYYADVKAADFATPLALAQLGAALASYGDQMRADAMFRRAGQRLAKQAGGAEPPLWRVDYGTGLRDAAAVLTLAAEAGSEALDRAALAARVAPAGGVGRTLSTQESLWSLMAANALIEDTAPGAFLINGQPAGGPVAEVLDAADPSGRRVEVVNNSGRDATTVLTTFGIPAVDAPASGNGYAIRRFYYTLDGKQVSPERVALNERLVVILQVKPERYSEARLMVNDPLPAGFEIDNPNLVRSGDVKALDWVKLGVEPRHAEFRADRFLAAVDWSSKEDFQLAYIVRAVSPGTFRHPAASVEDMYRPTFRARTGVGRVIVE